MSLKIIVDDRKYKVWKIINYLNFEDVDNPEIDPYKTKLFNQDVFNMNGTEIHIKHSTVRNTDMLLGVLVLDTKTTYGKVDNKFYYQCIPDDRRLPVFLITYNKKEKFSKKAINKYVIFKFKHWNDKHPIGELINSIGDVDKLGNFYEYQLYCKSLYASIQNFNKETMKALKNKSEETYIHLIKEANKIENRESWNVYTIDPKTSKDYDDAFSIRTLNDNTVLLSIYIANVSLWMNIMNLWNSFSKRISTIYLPDRKRPMLPTILSDVLCSLNENTIRFAFTMDIYLDENGVIIEKKYLNTSIKVKRNFAYEEKDLLNNSEYKKLFIIVKLMNKQNYYLDHIHSSHDVINYLMVLMNYLSAKEFLKYNNGLFRSFKYNNDYYIPDGISDELKKFLKTWYGNGSKYVKVEDDHHHDIMKFNEYIHITSPIRRLVDLLNLLQLQDNLNILSFNDKSKLFYHEWIKDDMIDYINLTMRSIRKVQNDCELLTKLIQIPYLLETIYSGCVFDKIQRKDGLFQYVVFLKELKLVSKLITYKEISDYTEHNFKLYLFQDKEQLKRKVRIELQI
uniref:RNB domain-containing protein n=1 Tax=viral metagenome TaxID=1070528 RepID=A0A6C0KJG9_9ZZZZ